MRWTIAIGLACIALTSTAQQTINENIPDQPDKKITVYGKVVASSFNYSKRRDTCTLQLNDENTGKLVFIKILPEARAGFGYRPEDALLNRVAMFTGELQNIMGQEQMYISSPFSIEFKKGDVVISPGMQAEPVARQIKPVSTNNAALEIRTVSKPVENKTQVNKAVKQQPIVVAKKNEADTIKKDDKLVAATQRPTINNSKPIVQQPVTSNTETNPPKVKETVLQATKTSGSTFIATGEKRTNIYVTGNNPNPLSKAPVGKKSALVGEEMILKSKVSLKGGPGGFFITTGSLNKGELIKILSCSFDWCKVTSVQQANGTYVQGYVKADKLKQQL